MLAGLYDLGERSPASKLVLTTSSSSTAAAKQWGAYDLTVTLSAPTPRTLP